MDTSHSLYSTQLSDETRARWKASGYDPEKLPSEPLLRQLLDAVYQASLLREEGEPVRCRVILGSPAEFRSLPSLGTNQLMTLMFKTPTPLSAHQIRKLAAAAGFYRSLLAVDIDPEDGELKLWGIINTGTRWVNRVSGSRPDELPLPPNLVIQILGPGHLVVASGDIRIFETSGGVLLRDGFDPFLSAWLPERFQSVKEALVKILESSPHQSTAKICHTFMQSTAQSVIRRAISLIRTRGHGGMLTYICDQEDAEALASRWFRFRVFFQQDEGTRRFRQLIVRLIERLTTIGQARGLAVVTWSDYQRIMDAEVQDIDDAMVEFAHVLADFMSVDGALVLDRSFRVIGFGAEILGDSHVSIIHRALDLEANHTIAEPADASGTRHRAAYRLVSGMPDVIALVVSQDGAVRFVANHHQKVTYWPYLP
ncbi:putative sensor domain DACNV-containing protein [Planctomicrobium sp. SH661]|uniref:putative sensor domain DACNV-containing protein n=1 Tax=Planctomicrobium sp. SH661 TaxID=3448124 RepID=UPI003F5C5127